jgi:hypothetical protein
VLFALPPHLLRELRFIPLRSLLSLGLPVTLAAVRIKFPGLILNKLMLVVIPAIQPPELQARV